VIHPTSIPVSREQRRAKTYRLDTALLMRAVLDWLRGEPKHCNMVAIPSLAEEDARRPSRGLDVARWTRGVRGRGKVDRGQNSDARYTGA
jgi:transposase